MNTSIRKKKKKSSLFILGTPLPILTDDQGVDKTDKNENTYI